MKLKYVLSLVLVASLLPVALTSCSMPSGKSNTATTAQTNKFTDDSNWDVIRDAYIYTFPLVLLDATKTKMANTVTATAKQAPVNQFIHAEKLADSSSKDVVSPNVDTVYSQVLLDLSNGSVMMEKPAVDRFCSIEVIDAYTNCAAVLGTGGHTQAAQKYIFTTENSTDTIPDGYKQVKLPTTMGWIIVRNVCSDEDDITNVKQIQNAFKVYTYEQYKNGTTDEKAKGTYSEENQYTPIDYVTAMTPSEYFSAANRLMEINSPAAADSTILSEIQQIGVGAGLTFDSSVLGDNYAKNWKQMITGLQKMLVEDSKKFYVNSGSWIYFGKPIAEFGTEYEYRALIALGGLGANPVSVAVYPKATVDSNNKRLDGNNNYIVHFDADQFPPVKENGFWSITAYDSSNNFLVDNSIDRYCINDRSKMKYNDDGSLDIYVQPGAPDDEHISNWLPVCEGEFHLMLRIYLPQENVIENKWQTPLISMQ